MCLWSPAIALAIAKNHYILLISVPLFVVSNFPFRFPLNSSCNST